MTGSLAKAGWIEAGATRAGAALRPVSLAIAGSLFVAICAHISVPLLFSPVPLTLQPFAVLLLGLLLGPGTAFAALALYLAEGAAGFPVFTPNGIGGILQLLGPTGGYLLSYPFVAAMVSWLKRQAEPKFSTRAYSAAAGSILILLCGATWLTLLTHAQPKTILNTAVLPFVPGDTLKVVAAAALATAWFRIRGRQPQGDAD
ncbi:MAG TPA: biotin transporter BioY [Acidisarcina sp.]|nr:biotin transporter BioY [Acidisarcina sp.]